MKFLYYLSKLIKKIHLPAIRNSEINKTSKVCSGSHIVNVTMGKYSYIGNFCTIINVRIGSFCSIADNCIIGGASHPLDWVSTSPVFHKGKNVMNKNFSAHDYITTRETEIGNDVWIGSSSLIRGGVKISDGAVIGMGSVVTKDVGAYEIWAGNPARMIRKRFNEGIIKDLNNIKWWELSDKEIYKISKSFNNIDKYIDKINKGSDF